MSKRNEPNIAERNYGTRERRELDDQQIKRNLLALFRRYGLAPDEPVPAGAGGWDDLVVKTGSDDDTQPEIMHAKWHPTGEDWIKLTVALAITHKETGFKFSPLKKNTAAEGRSVRDRYMTVLMDEGLNATEASKEAKKLINAGIKARIFAAEIKSIEATSIESERSSLNTARRKAEHETGTTYIPGEIPPSINGRLHAANHFEAIVAAAEGITARLSNSKHAKQPHVWKSVSNKVYNCVNCSQTCTADSLAKANEANGQCNGNGSRLIAPVYETGNGVAYTPKVRVGGPAGPKIFAAETADRLDMRPHGGGLHQTIRENPANACGHLEDTKLAQLGYQAGEGRGVLDGHGLSDEQWERVRHLLPGKAGGRDPSVTDNRRFLEAVLWIAGTGAPWRDLPENFGNWNSNFRRFRRWAAKGVFDPLFEQLSGDREFEYAMIDGSIVRVHQRGTGARGGLNVRRSDGRAAA